MRLGRRDQWTRGAALLARTPPPPRQELEGPAMGLGRGPSARPRRTSGRRCGSRQETATCSARSRITPSESRGGGRLKVPRLTNHPPPSAWRLCDGGLPSVGLQHGHRRALKGGTGLLAEEDRPRDGPTGATAVTPSTVASGRRSTSSRPTNCAQGRQKKSHKSTSLSRLAVGVPTAAATAWRTVEGLGAAATLRARSEAALIVLAARGRPPLPPWMRRGATPGTATTSPAASGRRLMRGSG
jgi:hypothetical protein